ncbi:MAG: 30S ribosomal protein S2 [Candidatus ainarchaeum sp.]|jgi:small subunit ribosomal protein S2|nr:30S ribosomal protein S2 [Candidatus ainarchaeum sp.]MDD3085740.1 30S ribosomal protein S2 [Candidatus ainarchaeum sp.]MDD4128473.1 30S ribosomal protein S2 [Candidatus ainarchaeum sp.]MDD4467876.1 30S ribosomal protein S2 [Candidatus ainarchaeum sp.]HPM85528.1 30S ribosomal protein S2 [archaeon]
MDEKTVEKENKQEFDETEFYKGKDLLIDIETYLKSGVHIGTKFKTGEMKRHIFKKRKDGLMVFNIETIDQRIRMVSKMLAKYNGKEIVVVARRLYGHKPARKMAAMIGAKEFIGRFIPGTFTNPQARIFYEPKIILVTDPIADSQAIKEATEVGIPVIAITGSDSPLKNIDIAIPANNKGRKALSLIYYLLTREVLVERKEITRETFNSAVNDFEQEIDENQEEKTKKSFLRFPRRPTGFRRRE